MISVILRDLLWSTLMFALGTLTGAVWYALLA